MAFKFFKWLIRSRDAPEPVTMEEMLELFSDLYIRELAFLSCVNLVANAVSKCEVKTYINGENRKGGEWYRWNYSPNKNQNSSAFWHKVIYSMYRDRAALIVEVGGDLLVADSWNRTEYATREDVFTDVTVGDMTFRKSFPASEVLFFESSAEDMKTIVDGIYHSYSQLIAYGMKGYKKSRGEKGTLELDTNAAGDPKFIETFESIKNEGFRRFAEADNAVMPLYRGMKYSSLASKTYNSDTTRDIRAMIDDITDFTARAFGIPAPLVNNSVQNVESATDQFLTFCVDPLVDNLQEEINRKRYGMQAVTRGSYMEFDTRRIKHIDLLEASSGIEKLVGSGVESINDIRGLLGQPLINEPWAWEHFITKNYSTVAEALAAMEEGETN